MKLDITVATESKRTIEIDLPYYYKHDLMCDYSDTIIYGKILENKCVSITINHDSRNDRISAEIEIERRPASTMGCYFKVEHVSSEEEFLEAKNEAIEIIDQALGL